MIAVAEREDLRYIIRYDGVLGDEITVWDAAEQRALRSFSGPYAEVEAWRYAEGLEARRN